MKDHKLHHSSVPSHAQRYLNLLTLLPDPPTTLQQSHWVLIHLIVGLVSQPVLISLW